MGGRDASGDLPAGEWRLGIAYRSLTANKWYVGKKVREDLAPFGKTLHLDMDTVDTTLRYGVTDQLSLSLTIPYLNGEHSRYYGDGKRHEAKATGVGDINLIADYWLHEPRQHRTGNVSIGLGVKSPSGKEDSEDDWYVPGGSFQFPVDQSIQLGDGGWGWIVRGHGYRELSANSSWYAAGSYLLSPKNTTHVTYGPGGAPISVPDVYYGRSGVAFTLSKKHQLSASLGARVDGLPKHDLVGESDGFRRPVLIAFVDPALTYVRGRSTFSINVPVLVYEDFKRSLLDERTGKPGGGDLAEYLFFFGFEYRF